jgi:type I restriction enzyme S subunit
MFTSRATIGAVTINTTPACTNQGFINCVPSARATAYELYFWLRENTPKITSLATGATFKEINKRVFRGLPYVLAPEDVRGRYVQTVTPICERIEIGLRQRANLRTTRDLLLPKLISGELDVSRLAEAPVEATV